MTDGQMLFAAFTAFYLIECFHWLPASGTVLRTFLVRRGWHVTTPWLAGDASASGLSFAWPLPLLGGLVLSQDWPVLPDSDGLWIGESQTSAGKRVAWSDVAPVVERFVVTVCKGVEVRCVSAHSARQLHEFLQSAIAAKAGNKRNQIVEAWWQRSLSVSRARSSARVYRIATGTLRMPCMMVFAIAFIWLPLLYWMHSDDHLRLLLGVVALLASTTLVAFTWRSYDRRIFGKARRSRWAQVLHLIFMPMHSIRAHDLIGTDIMADLHALPSAAALLPRAEFQAFAAKLWRRWLHRGPTDPMREASTLVLPRLRACCERLRLPVSEFDAAPSRQEGSLSYCPCCQAQFTKLDADCPDCHGLATKAF